MQLFAPVFYQGEKLHTQRPWCVFFVDRYDKEGHALDGQSMTEMRGGGSGGPTNWKTLADVKNEHLGHGDKVSALLIEHVKKQTKKTINFF